MRGSDLFMGLVGVSALAGLAAGGGTNLLQNGDLEDGMDNNSADGWTLVEPNTDVDGNPTNSAEFVGFANNTPGGERGLWFRSFEGGLGDDEPFQVDATLSQTVGGSGGIEYTLSAFSLFEAGFTAEALNLSIEFLDGDDNVLGSNTLDLFDVQMNDAMWREFSVSAVSAAGTESVRVSASMVDGALSDTDPQSAFVDDFTLVPTPGGFSLLAVAGLAVCRRRR